MDAGFDTKRRRTELFNAPMGVSQKTPEEIKESFDDAVKSHPFVDLSEHIIEYHSDGMFFDSEGNLCGALIRNAIPEHAAQSAANVLRAAATRTSLRATIFGGEAPLSGIAGYYDYHGSPIEHKCRKTSFTCDALREWPQVFPMVEYVSEVYKAAAPKEWAAQNRAIPDNVRINNSPFSTLTINQRFRTASHTDAGDFDEGFGCLAVLEGDYEGLHLGFPNFRVCFTMRPRDVLLFNTHHFHANTELERLDGQASDWTRLSCVFYYRVFLGEPYCLQHYKRRWEEERKLPVSQRVVELPKNMAWVDRHDNGENNNRPATVHPVFLTPFLPLLSQIDPQLAVGGDAAVLPRWMALHGLCRLSIQQTRKLRQTFLKPIDGKKKQQQQQGGKRQSSLKEAVGTASSGAAAGSATPTNPNDAEQPFPSSSSSSRSVPPSESSEPASPTTSTTNISASGAPSSAASQPPPPSAILDPIAILLFGEETFERCADGLPERTADEKEVATFLQVSAGSSGKLGGFSEASGAREVADKNKSTLEEASLRLFLPPDLLTMWIESRSAWLGMVKRDWAVMVRARPDRDDFSWKNKSDMNTAFFELCDVAQQVMLTILEKEVATKAEENAFWLAFAGHLHHACAHELHMHPDAMSMKKLNVKLKDYNFGGTRYFHDMPPEEQERRLQRKKRIEQARRLGINPAARVGGSTSGIEGLDWMDNDRYDYQSESAAVPYEAQQWVTPEENARRTLQGATDLGQLKQRFGFHRLLTEEKERKWNLGSKTTVTATEQRPAAAAAANEDRRAAAVVRVTVVYLDAAPVPPTTPFTPFPATTPPVDAQQQETATSAEGRALLQSEMDRLLRNPAAIRSLNSNQNHNHVMLPAYEALLQEQNVSVTMLPLRLLLAPEDGKQEKEVEGDSDVVVLRFVCSYLSDDEVRRVLQLAKERLCRRTGGGGIVLVSDAVLSCRSIYLLKSPIRIAYEAIATPCMERLLAQWVPSLAPGGLLGRGGRGDDEGARAESGSGGAAEEACWVPTSLRTRSQWQALLPDSVASFYFDHSPRNTAVLVLKL